MDLYCKVSETDEEHSVEVPLFAYKGYQVMDQSGQELAMRTSEQKHIAFSLPNDYDGNVTIVFRDLPYWTAALWVSGAVVLCIVLCVLGKHGRKRV